jgi:hypothetical protein
MTNVEVRTYTARSQPQASALFARDAGTLASRGLYPTTQLWSAPQMWRVFVTPLILMIVGYILLGWLGVIGGAVIAVLYVALFFPKGALTVTYMAR